MLKVWQMFNQPNYYQHKVTTKHRHTLFLHAVGTAKVQTRVSQHINLFDDNICRHVSIFYFWSWTIH